MLVATFGPASGWDGRQIYWDDGRFVLYEHGAIPAAGLLEYDRLAYLAGASAEIRSWAYSAAQWEATGETGQAVQAAAGPTAGPAGRKGFPAWAVILLVAGVGVLVLGILLAILIPAFVLRTGENIADETAVRSGVRNIQMGIEAWAVDHGGSYPDAAQVNSSDLSPYISPWPQNPYIDLPMAQGPGAGNFTYEVGSGGSSFRLVGYGANGKVVIDLNGDLNGGGSTTY